MSKIKTALISVYDKTGIVDFCRVLQKKHIEIISSGGTSKVLKDAGIPVTEVSKYTKSPEILDGRVKTLHPKIHAGLLAVRKNKKHSAELKAQGAKPIDLIVVNLYPFEEKIIESSGRQPSAVSHQELIENIDIGGPALIRAAAKNYQDVTVVTNPSQYESVLSEISKKGAVSPQLNQFLAAEAFNYVAHYDAIIDFYFQRSLEKNLFPTYLNLSFKKRQDLRYGENPDQKAAFYKDALSRGGVGNIVQLQGKELSYNNLLDLNAAWNLVNEFSEPAIVIVKHTNPCGVAVAENLVEAFKRAYACDSLSAFGGIVAANREIGPELAKELSALFIEEIIAPSYSANALEILKSKEKVRVIQTAPMLRKQSFLASLATREIAQGPQPIAFNIRDVSAGLIVQTSNFKPLTSNSLKKVTKVKPTKEQLQDLLFAWKVCKHVKSNAIVFAKNLQAVGIGAGQMSRIDSVRIAIEKSKGRAPGSVMASDAFFPFKDSVELAADVGVSAIIQPGGSIKDNEVIKAANERGIAMVLTGVRVFRH